MARHQVQLWEAVVSAGPEQGTRTVLLELGRYGEGWPNRSSGALGRGTEPLPKPQPGSRKGERNTQLFYFSALISCFLPLAKCSKCQKARKPGQWCGPQGTWEPSGAQSRTQKSTGWIQWVGMGHRENNKSNSPIKKRLQFGLKKRVLLKLFFYYYNDHH